MNRFDSEVANALEHLVPPDLTATPRWRHVLSDAHGSSIAGDRVSRSRRLPFARTRWALAAIAALAATIPLSALAITRDWWFLGTAPSPTGDIVTIQQGVSGKAPWYFLAYISKSDGICYGVTSQANDRQIGALNCDRDVMRAADSGTSEPPSRAIGFVREWGGGLPHLIAGAVAQQVRRVEVQIADGQLIRAATIPAPSNLRGGENLRFYVVRVPYGATPETVVGKDDSGRIVGRVRVSN